MLNFKRKGDFEPKLSRDILMQVLSSKSETIRNSKAKIADEAKKDNENLFKSKKVCFSFKPYKDFLFFAVILLFFYIIRKV